MRVRIRVHDYLLTKITGQPAGTPSWEQSFPAGGTVRELLRVLALDEKWVGLVVINGRQGGRDTVLADGDHVELFAPMSGG